MSNKKSEKIKKNEANLFSGSITGIKIAAEQCEFQVKSKKHGVQHFSIDPKVSVYFGVIVAALAGKHKVTVQTASEIGNEKSLTSIAVGELQKFETPEKIKKTKKSLVEKPAVAV